MNSVVVAQPIAAMVSNLPATSQKRFDAAIHKLKTAPQNGKPLAKHLIDDVWSIRIDKEYRLKYAARDQRIEVFELHKVTDREKEAENDLVISYMSLRKLIGICGMALPVALAIFPKRPTSFFLGLEPSISDYYYTNRGDFLVVLLSILSIFLFTYKGYNTIEKMLTRLAGVCALGVAFVPTQVKCEKCAFSVHTLEGGVLGNIAGEGLHLICAGTFLLCLAYISFKYFPQTDAATLANQGNKLTQKGKRNIIFRLCAWVIFGCVGLLLLYFLLKPDLKSFPIIFVLETVAVEAFGISWLTKGEGLLPDKK